MTSTTKTRAQIVAESIATEALGQGLSLADLGCYDLTKADICYIRAEYPTPEYPADAMSHEEWRSVILEVERAVREH